MDISIADFHFLVFIIPGLITVWTFRYFTNSKKTGDFEFLGLSFFWGIIVLVIMETLSRQHSLDNLLKNPYATAIVLSAFGFIFGCIAGRISRTKIFKIIMNFLGKNK